MKLFSNRKLYIIPLFLLALSLRLFGIDWDQGNHLHPDERFLTMVTADIKLPQNIGSYFDSRTSPLNPYNYSQYQFFVYGTFPIFFTKFLSVVTGFDGYDQVYILGRFLSAVFDSFNVVLLYILSLKVFKKPSSYRWQLLPSFLYTFCVLPIQLSHFYAVDTYLTFFILATFTSLAFNNFWLSGITFGLALASKISAIYFVPIIGVLIAISFFKSKNVSRLLLMIFLFLFFTTISFRIFQPYIFDGIYAISPHFIDNLKQLKAMTSSDGNFPPSVQWLSKTPLLFSLQNIILWGLGLPITFLCIVGFNKFSFKKSDYYFNTALAWVIFLYLYQGSQFAHTMRYFMPIYPFVILVSAYLSQYTNKVLLKILITLHLVFGFMFLSIYTRPHTRVQASEWIYKNLSPGSNITNEYWDDPLPLYLRDNSPYVYNGTMLSLYDADTPEKWEILNPVLEKTDYIIMSSNRLWGSIPLVPDKYPNTANFYQNLFAHKSNFTKFVEINSYPGIGLSFLDSCYYLGPTNFPGLKQEWFAVDNNCEYPGVYFRDDIAEEAFSVYDHPKVLIFSRQ